MCSVGIAASEQVTGPSHDPLMVWLERECFIKRILDSGRCSPALAEGVCRLLECARGLNRLEGLQHGTRKAFELMSGLAQYVGKAAAVRGEVPST